MFLILIGFLQVYLTHSCLDLTSQFLLSVSCHSWHSAGISPGNFHLFLSQLIIWIFFSSVKSMLSEPGGSSTLFTLFKRIFFLRLLYYLLPFFYFIKHVWVFLNNNIAWILTIFTEFSLRPIQSRSRKFRFFVCWMYVVPPWCDCFKVMYSKVFFFWIMIIY